MESQAVAKSICCIAILLFLLPAQTINVANEGPAPIAAWIGQGDQKDARYGTIVAPAGDVNGDGYADVIVGMPFCDKGEADEGCAYVYYGSPNGLSQTPGWAAEGNQTGAEFGHAAGTAGDINGDGYDDVIIGAYAYDHDQEDEGRAYVYLGSSSGLSHTPVWWAEGNQRYAYFGYAVGTAGDVNGDGYDDIIVGAHFYGNGQTDEGRAYVFHGSPSGPSPHPNWSWESDQAICWFGWSVSTAGDVNGDGYDDVIIGAPYYHHGQEAEGGAFVFHGSALGLGMAPAWVFESDQERAYLGWSVGAAGDVNDDGYADVIIGAPYYSYGQQWEGRAYVFYGSAAGLSSAPSWSGEPDLWHAHLGRSVSGAGDANGDGIDDVIAGAEDFDGDQPAEGRALVYCGSVSGLATAVGWAGEGNQSFADYGWSVAGVGDTNRDGCDEVIVGAPRYDNGQEDEGAAFLYYGRPGTVQPGRGAGLPGILQTFTTTFRNAGGWQNIRYADLLINATQQTTQCVYLRYDAQSDRLYLQQPAGRGWLGGGQPGDKGTVQNVYGALDYGRSNAITDTTTITITWALTLTWRNSGRKHNLYLSTETLTGERTSWADHGNWVVNRAPNWLIPPSLANQTVSAGERITLDPRYRDPDGWQNLHVLFLAIADRLPTGEMIPGGVFLKYDQRRNRMYLSDVAGSGWLPPQGLEPSTPTILENDFVKLIGEWSNVGVYDAKTRIVRWRLEFKPAFKGTHRLYMRAKDAFAKLNGDTGWKYKGTLKVQ